MTNEKKTIEMAMQVGGTVMAVYSPDLIAFAKLVAQHEREACAYRAGIALLGADRNLANRVNQAIQERGQA